MSYTKHFDPSKFEPIEDTLKQMQSLEPGGKLFLHNFPMEHWESYRWLIYDWLHHMGLRGKFRVKVVEGLPMVIRKGFPPVTLEKQGAELEVRLDNILKEMITSEKPLDLVREKARLGTITPEELGVLIAKFDEVMK